MPGQNKAGKGFNHSPTLSGTSHELDPYLPHNGNLGYRISRYDLKLEYRVSANRLAGTAELTATSYQQLAKFTLDLATSLRVDKVSVNRKSARFTHRNGKVTITPQAPIPAGGPMDVVIRYSGNPRPVRSAWGTVGWEELSNGSLCANQPNGAPSWFPCDDHPEAKATYLFTITADSPYYVLANGVAISQQRRGATTTWVYEQVEPMSTYLASIQVGQYDHQKLATKPVPVYALVPPQLKSAFQESFGGQVQMLEFFTEVFGPYPFPQYTAVVTEDPLDIPLEAQSFSTFGANHCDGSLDHERLVAHELAHQWFGNSVTLGRWRDIWLHEGFACYAEWLWSERSGGRSADEWARHYYEKVAATPVTETLADPGPKQMFEDWVYKRGALTLHALRLRIGDRSFFGLLHRWTDKYRYRSVTTEDFIALAGTFSDDPLHALWREWLFEPALPAFPLPR